MRPNKYALSDQMYLAYIVAALPNLKGYLAMCRLDHDSENLQGLQSETEVSIDKQSTDWSDLDPYEM